MKRLGVNVDHVATLRQARRTEYPDPLAAAQLAIRGGADQITVHLREDRRHIQDRDVERMRAEITVPLNLEMAATPEITAIACRIRPHTATLVPERRKELTTEGGLAVAGNKAAAGCIKDLKRAGIRVSLFIDPDPREVAAAAEAGADAIELHTGAYCSSADAQATERERGRLAAAANRGTEAGLGIAAGHGLHYDNVAPLVAAVPLIEEYNIGHAIVARAVFDGLETAVRLMKDRLAEEGAYA